MTHLPFECCHCGSTDDPRHVGFDQCGRMEVVACADCGVYDGRVTALGAAETQAAIDAGLCDFDDPEAE